MNKHYILAAVILLCELPALQAADKDRVHDAIEAVDAASVKKFLRRMGPLSLKEKKGFLESAEDVVEERERHVSLLRSPWDLTKFLGGSLLGGYLAYKGWGIYSDVEDELDTEEKATIGFCAIVGALSFYTAFKGFMCSCAKHRLALANKVVDEIEKASVADHSSECPVTTT